MCSPLPEGDPDFCGAQCYTDPSDVVVGSTSTLEYGRYCFYECKPTTVRIGDSCTNLEEDEMREVAGEEGNPKDMAGVLDGIPKGDGTAGGGGGGGAGAGAGAGGAAAEPAGASKEDNAYAEAAASTSEDAAKEALAAATEARAAGAQAKSQKALSQAFDAYHKSMDAFSKNKAAVAEQKGLVQQAELHARAADRARVISENAVDAIRQASQQAADSAAAEAKAKMEHLAQLSTALAAGIRAKFSFPLGHTANAAGAVTGPYNAAILRAQLVRDQYRDKAQALAATAKQLQINAHIVGSQAVAYQAAGSSGVADKLLAQAHGAMAQVNGYMQEAEKWQVAAQSIQDSLPLYGEAAAAAAARAAALAKPEWMVPPPLPGA
jgi:hypothetical protein